VRNSERLSRIIVSTGNAGSALDLCVDLIQTSDLKRRQACMYDVSFQFS
jgi:hypothetical protein